MQILTGDDIIIGDEYFRQKEFCPYDSDNFAVSTFISKWTSIRYLLGDVWQFHQLKELDIRDEHYPHNPTFLKTYEFIRFSSEDEKNLVEIYSDSQMKEKNKRMWCCFRTWKDWGAFFVSTLSDDEIEKIKHIPDNICPVCEDGLIIEKSGRYGKFKGCTNFPKCRYIEDKLNDNYFEFEQRKNEINYLKKIIGQMGK
jgi:hypothetical protein